MRVLSRSTTSWRSAWVLFLLLTGLYCTSVNGASQRAETSEHKEPKYPLIYETPSLLPRDRTTAEKYRSTLAPWLEKHMDRSDLMCCDLSRLNTLLYDSSAVIPKPFQDRIKVMELTEMLLVCGMTDMAHDMLHWLCVRLYNHCAINMLIGAVVRDRERCAEHIMRLHFPNGRSKTTVLCDLMRQWQSESIILDLLDTMWDQLGTDFEGQVYGIPAIMEHAIVHDYVCVVEDLLDRGVDPRFLERNVVQFPPILHVLCVKLEGPTRGESDDENCREVNAISQSWPRTRTPSVNVHREILELLVEGGIDLEVHNHRGQTPLLHAIELQHAHMVELLLEAGAESTHCDPEKSPLALAVLTGNRPILDAFQRHGHEIPPLIDCL